MRLGLHALFLAVLVGPALCVGGCAATVIPREPAIDPVPVYLADYGIHSSLFLPTPDGRYVEYAFGDITIACSNIDRVMFPADGITKGELIAYYHEVAALIKLARVRLHSSGRDLQKGRFPRAVAPDQTDALPFQNRRRRLVEHDLIAKAHDQLARTGY